MTTYVRVRCGVVDCKKKRLPGSDWCELHGTTDGKRKAYQTPLGRRLRPVSLLVIAKEAGVSLSMMQKVSTGDRKPNAKIRQALQRLNIEPSEIFPEEE